MRDLGLEIRNKIAKQKAVGHTKGCVVPHELMEEWAKLADDLVKNNSVLDAIIKCDRCLKIVNADNICKELVFCTDCEED